MKKRYLFYLLRWQLSTPVLATVLGFFPNDGTLKWLIISTMTANLIGGLGFFWVDRLIFKNKKEKQINDK